MGNEYKPPEIPPFPMSVEDLLSVLAPYYHDQRPLDLFFEFLVVDIVGVLPQETDTAIRQLVAKHPTFFASAGGDWRSGVRLDLNLSATIDIAILDLWHRNSRKSEDDGWSYHPWHFAQDFLANYLADDSLVDVWEGDSLQQAKARIQASQRSS